MATKKTSKQANKGTKLQRKAMSAVKTLTIRGGGFGKPPHPGPPPRG